MQQEPVTIIATRLIRYTHLLDLRASCYAAIEAQRKIIEHDGQTSSHSLSLHSLQGTSNNPRFSVNPAAQ